MSKKIKINTITPSGSDGSQLIDYYFEAFGEGYNIYSPTSSGPVNSQLLTPANPSCTINVTGYPAFTLTITQFPVLIIRGSWSDSTSDKDVPGSGTFQAQAGGTGTFEEEAAAATAK